MERARCKDLLRLEKPYMQAPSSPKAAAVHSLLNAPPSKPDFSALPRSALLSQLESFLPAFKQDTQQLIANPELAKHKQMDNLLLDARGLRKSKYQKKHKKKKATQTRPHIAMDLAGVFDLKEEEEKEKEKALIEELEAEVSTTAQTMQVEEQESA